MPHWITQLIDMVPTPQKIKVVLYAAKNFYFKWSKENFRKVLVDQELFMVRKFVIIILILFIIITVMDKYSFNKSIGIYESS